MLKEVRPALVLLLLLSALTGLAYPLAITGIAQVAFPSQADGSLIVRDGKVVGSALVGQNFSSERYFHPRPSATAPEPYNAASSGGSNYGPTSTALIERVRVDVSKRKGENPEAAVPTDLVTASGSGLDPHISPEAAQFQAPRVAEARGIQADIVWQLVRSQVEGRTFGFLGEPRVNVLRLNLALDSLQAR